MPDVLSVSEASTRLGTSRQTIRTYLRNGTLQGSQSSRGVWNISKRSVDRFLATHGRLNGGRRRKSALAVLDQEVRELREQVSRLTASESHRAAAELFRERDELRARVVALEDALAKMRDAAELQRLADVERAQVVGGLLAALSAAERADAHRREALELLEDGVAASLVPGHPGAGH